MKKEFPIEEEWISYELHPETPEHGMLLADRFPGHDLEGMYNHLRQRGKSMGIAFGKMVVLSNSRKALEASEYARDMGKHELFHEKIFHAYFTKAQNISEIPVILAVAKECGLDENALADALAKGQYSSRIQEASRKGRKHRVSAVPTFLIEDKKRVEGAEHIEVFREVLGAIQADF